MLRRIFAIAAGVTTLALAFASSAFADNSATGSVGAVQVGSTTATPSVSATVSTVSATVSAPTAVAGGGNTSSQSVGTAQVGGGNSASNSAGVVQVNGVSTAPSASATAAGNSASAHVPVTIG